MHLGERVNEILSRWQSEDIRPRNGSIAVWDTHWPGLFSRRRRLRKQAVVTCRRELLSCLLASEVSLFIVHGDSPEGCGVPGPWQWVAQSTWKLPKQFDFDHPDAKYWLFHLGNWCMYSAAAPVQVDWPDPARCSASELVSWMKKHSVTALIDSFHDDVSWVIAAI